MSEPSFRIREARLPDDRPAILRFIAGLQNFEKQIEPDRRVDETVAEEFYAVVLDRLAKRHGAVFIAEADGVAVGWAQAHEEENAIYVMPEERRYGHIAELYVIDDRRGHGIGRALIAACEVW